MIFDFGLGSSNNSGRAFFQSSSNADSSFIEPERYTDRLYVKISRLDSLALPESDFRVLKLEAEGAEPEVLEGLGNEPYTFKYIFAELGFERGLAQESTLTPVTNFLLSKNFEIVSNSRKRLALCFKNKNWSIADQS